MKTKSIYGLIAVVAILIAATALSTNIPLNAQAQNATSPPQAADPTQIKNYLTEAITALDSGNNTKALEQIDLADDQLSAMTGSESVQDDDDDEEEGGVEEGAGEDVDEAGDVDTNDQEDSP